MEKQDKVLNIIKASELVVLQDSKFKFQLRCVWLCFKVQIELNVISVFGYCFALVAG